MRSSELRELQAPLKERYRAAPEAALVTLRAHGQLGEETLTCKVETGGALVEAGLHPATGGDGLSACSGDMLLEALVACAGVTLRAVATALDIDAPADKLDSLIKLTERYCVVYQTLKTPAQLALSVGTAP